MKKNLADMSREELWQLFPIILTPPCEAWPQWFAEEQARLAAALPLDPRCIHHIGSTAIQGIWAKPIIDLLVEMPAGAAREELKLRIIRCGYICMSEAAGRASFNRGYTPEGFADRVFHLHLRRAGDHAELYFRDYMNERPALAKQYETLKLALREKYEHDRDAYTEAKAEFVSTHTAAARRYYGARYGA